jgi:putative membrane protein
MPRLYLIGAASLAALGFAACGEKTTTTAETTTTPTETTATTASIDTEAAIREGQEFVNAAGQAGVVEIRTSEMALEKSKNADVKAFAQKIIDDHKAAGEKLNAAASAAALAAPPATLDDFHMRRINDLVETDGDADFDADYMALQVDAHNDAVKLFEDYSKDVNAISQLKTFADETLPTLAAHKADAERIRDAVNKTDKSANPS